jgi:tetratricopeptide (TPR) repeat protein
VICVRNAELLAVTQKEVTNEAHGEEVMTSTRVYRMESADALYQMAQLCLLSKDYVQAGTFFQECLDLMPEHVDALTNLAMVLYTTKRIEAALATYRKALEQSPNNPVVLNGLGNCYRAMGEFDKADAYYKRAYYKRASKANR